MTTSAIVSDSSRYPPAEITLGPKAKTFNKAVIGLFAEFLQAFCHAAYKLCGPNSSDEEMFTWEAFGECYYQRYKGEDFSDYCEESIALAKASILKKKLAIFEVSMLSASGEAVASYKVAFRSVNLQEFAFRNEKKEREILHDMQLKLEKIIETMKKSTVPEAVRTRIAVSRTRPRIRQLIQPKCCIDALLDHPKDEPRKRLAPVADAVSTPLANICTFATFNP